MPTFQGETELRRHGIHAENSANYARAQAMLHGIRLCGLTGNIWPRKDNGLYQLVANEIISELTSFAIQARRYMEITGNKRFKIDGPLVKIDLPEFRYETDLWTAVNRIVHAQEIEVFSAAPVPEKHDNLGDLVVVNVRVTSPQRDADAICPQGMFYGFGQSPLG